MASARRSWRARGVVLAGITALVGCDHASKLAAEATLRHHASVVVVPGMMDLAYTENRDVAFSALSRFSLHSPPWLLTALTLGTTILVLVAWARRKRASFITHAGFALVSAGAIGNGLDRLLRGRVVDFIQVRFWPVFNLADVLIVVGIALLLLARRSHESAVDTD